MIFWLRGPEERWIEAHSPVLSSYDSWWSGYDKYLWLPELTWWLYKFTLKTKARWQQVLLGFLTLCESGVCTSHRKLLIDLCLLSPWWKPQQLRGVLWTLCYIWSFLWREKVRKAANFKCQAPSSCKKINKNAMGCVCVFRVVGL